VDDDGEDATEVDVYQIDPNGLIHDEVELVSQDTGSPVQLFEPIDGYQRSDCAR